MHQHFSTITLLFTKNLKLVAYYFQHLTNIFDMCWNQNTSLQ